MRRAIACRFGRRARYVCVECSESWAGIVKLNHLNLTVTDVPETRRLFDTYFGLKRVGEGGNENFDVV